MGLSPSCADLHPSSLETTILFEKKTLELSGFGAGVLPEMMRPTVLYTLFVMGWECGTLRFLPSGFITMGPQDITGDLFKILNKSPGIARRSSGPFHWSK